MGDELGRNLFTEVTIVAGGCGKVWGSDGLVVGDSEGLVVANGAWSRSV